MSRMIRHIIEPSRLFLAWQAPEGSPHGRTRRKVAELVPERDGTLTFRYLRETEDFEVARSAGFLGYPAFPLERDCYGSGVLDTFMRRLPPPKRRDYNDFLRMWRLDPTSTIPPLALLGYVGAQLPGDGFSLVHPFDNGEPPFEFLEEVAGFRHLPDAQELWPRLQAGQEVHLRSEPDNPHDSLAIRIELPDHHLVGYVNKLQTPGMHRWLQDPGVRGTIDRLTGIPSRPLVYVFLEVGVS